MEQDLQDVTQLMKQNLNSVLERGEKMNNLVNKSGRLADDSMSFRRAAQTASRKQWWDHWKDRIWVIVAVVLLIWVFFYLVCGVNIFSALVGGG